MSSASKPASDKARHAHRLSADDYDPQRPHEKGVSWYLSRAAATEAPRDKDPGRRQASESGEYLPAKSRASSSDSGYSEFVDSGQACDRSSVDVAESSPKQLGNHRLSTSATGTRISIHDQRPLIRAVSQRAHRPAPPESAREQAEASRSTGASVERDRSVRSRSNSETSCIRTSGTMHLALAGMPQSELPGHRSRSSTMYPLARSSLTQDAIAAPAPFASAEPGVKPPSSFSKPLPRIPEPLLSPLSLFQPSTSQFKHPQFQFQQRAQPPNVIFKPPESSEPSLHRRALSSSKRSNLPTEDEPTPDPLARAKAVYRRSSLDYRFDVREILDALEEANTIFLRHDVKRVKEIKNRFVAAVQTGMMLLNTLPDEVRTSGSVRLAHSEVVTYENVFSSFCSNISGKHSDAKLEELFCLGPQLLALLWTSLGELVKTCAAVLDAYNATPETYAHLEASDGEANSESVKTVQSALAAALRRGNSKRLKGFLSRAVRSVLPKTVANDSTPVGSTPARFSWILLDQEEVREPKVGPFEESEDKIVTALNLELKSTKLVFDTITRHFLNHDTPHPRYSGNQDVVLDANNRAAAMTIRALVNDIVDGFASDLPELDIVATTDSFFLFFRCFTRGQKVMDLLCNRFFAQLPVELEGDLPSSARWKAGHAVTKIQVVRLLTFWLDHYYLPEADAALLRTMREIKDAVEADADLPPNTSAALGIKLVECQRGCPGRKWPTFPPVLERTLKEGERNAPAFGDSGFSASAVRAIDTVELSLIDVLFFDTEAGGAEELARAFTLVESEIFHGALPYEVYFHREDKPHRMFAAAAAWSNAVCLWTVQCVVDKASMTDRANAYNLLARVMNRCLELRNYSTAYSIWSGLSSAAVTRLTSTLRMADVLCKTMVQEVDRYFHQSGSNYSTYRADFASSVAPAVPLFHVIQGDIIKIYARRRMVRDELGPLPDSADGGRWVFPQYLKQLRKVVRGLEKCYVIYGVPAKPAVKSWLEASVSKLYDVDFEKYMDKLGSQQVAEENFWFDRRV